MSEKIILYPEIGEVKFTKNTRAKRLNIRLKPNHPIQVTVPQRLSFVEAEKILQSKLDWIRKHLPKIQSIENQQTIFEENTIYQTKFHTIEIFNHAENQFQVQNKKGNIKLFYPVNSLINSDLVQKAIRQFFIKIWRKEAEIYLPQRTAELAQKYGFTYQKVRIRHAKTRWGSCTYDNLINLNLHLLRLPDELLDYVILHELCHTIHKNHAKEFWQLLDKVSGNARGLDKKLNDFRIEVF